MPNTIKFRRGESLQWRQVDPILENGEPGFERDTGRLKIGNGSSKWSELPYLESDSDDPELPDDGSLLDHINSTHPHPVYDDGPDLFLLYQNAKV